ncbi:MAG: DUF6526 family protein [Acidobacteriota bacterium]
MPTPQNYQNHARYFPLVHFVVVPLLTINLIYQLVRLYQEPNWDRGMFVVLSLVFILMTIGARLQALKAQDRVIRLEEMLRYERLLPEEVASASTSLPLGQVIALRFCSDEELADLVRRTGAGEFTKNKEIKRAVKNWRADHHRV